MPRIYEELPIGVIGLPRGVFEAPAENNPLRQSIAMVGVLNPITVVEEENHYRILAGARRYLCALALGHETIPAMIESDDTPAETRGFITYTENMSRSSNVVSEIEGIRNMAMEGLRFPEIQERFHLRGRPFLNRARIAFCPHARHRSDIISLLSNNAISLSTAAVVAQLPSSQRLRAINFVFTTADYPVPLSRIRQELDRREGEEGQYLLIQDEASAQEDVADVVIPPVTALRGFFDWPMQQRGAGRAMAQPSQSFAAAPTPSDVELPEVSNVRLVQIDAISGLPTILMLDGMEYIRSDREVATPAPTTLPDFWWRPQAGPRPGPGVMILADDIRGTRGWASVAALLEAAEATLPSDDMALADELAAKINGMMRRLQQHYQRNPTPPRLDTHFRTAIHGEFNPNATTVGVDMAIDASRP